MPKDERQQRAEQFRAACNSGVEVEVIPSRKDLGIQDEDRDELVAPYCRVSTLAESQVESYEFQKDYYGEYIGHNPHWTFIDIYADEGISATSMRNRKDFLRLIEDCKAGKVTRIITKSVSRFARNVVDCISTVRMLRALNPPVGVYFETEHIDTLARESDAQLSLLSSFAEAESLTKSTSMKWAIRGRFHRGIPRIVDLYGFVRQKSLLYIDEENAPHVHNMYEMRDADYGGTAVRSELHAMRVPSPSGLEYWPLTTIEYILANERYCGDVCMQKTVCIDVFSHKSVPNDGIERKYIVREHHPQIVEKDLWSRVQFKSGKVELSDFVVSGSENLILGGQSFNFVDPMKGVI